MARDGSTLPDWIPDGARFIYSGTGPYSDIRREQAIHALFHAAGLDDLFRYLGPILKGSEDQWAYLIGCVVNAAECVPEDGAATADRPDFKLQERARQAEANQLLQKIGIEARKLAGLLDDLDALQATVPGETYSSLALIESALDRNCAKDEFVQFKRGLSSYKRSGFPCPADLLQVLVLKALSQPDVSDIFADDPWLRSQKSTWRDFLRILAEDLSDIYLMHEVRIDLREKHWIALVQTLISPDISRSSINAACRELPPFSWEVQEE